MAAKNVVELTQDNWQQMVVDSPLPVVVDFWAVTCGPCRRIAPFIEELADQYEGKVIVGKVNVEDHPDLAAQFRINTIPQVYIFRNGQVAEQLKGVQPKSAYNAAVNKVISAA